MRPRARWPVALIVALATCLAATSCSRSNTAIVSIALHPTNPATVYAGTMMDAVYKSPDGGQHWMPYNVGLKEHVSVVNQFVFHPADSERLYAATTVGVFYSGDGGRTW